MKLRLYIWQIAGFLFTSIVGVLLHFLYDWTGQSLLAAPFSAVNESIWEHMKLLFFAYVLFALIQEDYRKEKDDNFWCAKLTGLLSGLLLIPAMYYTYTGVFGKSVDWFNIVIFFITTAVSYFVEARILNREKSFCVSERAAQVILVILAGIFIVFTFVPPQIPLFGDPLTGQYGIEK